MILTERCNSRCKYCYEKSMKEFENGLEEKWNYDDNVPFDSEVDIDKLKKFLKPEDRLIFYGGEPLLKIDKIKEIIEKINCKFGMQTNGLILDELPVEVLKKIDKILVSIDGAQKRTDENRGKENYERVLKNLKEIRDNRYRGEIIARMVVTKSDIFEQVLHILKLIDDGIFDSVHWQIDAGFYRFDFYEKNFEKFVEEYNAEIEKLISFWTSKMKEGKFYRIYPFVGVVSRILGFDKDEGIPCGSGCKNFTINTKGDLSACPIMNSVKNFYCGSVENGVTKKIAVENEECLNCDEFQICGGRCLYWRNAKLWPSVGDELICKTIKFLIETLRKKSNEIKKLIDDDIVKRSDFDYEKYFGPEIIP